MDQDAPFLGNGWSFPPLFDSANTGLRMVAGRANIAQSIDILLTTMRGSRALMPEFGNNLERFVFRTANAQTLEELAESARLTLLHGEPRIVVEAVRPTKSADGSMLELTIVYRVAQTNTRHNHVYPFASLEGNNLAPPARPTAS